MTKTDKANKQLKMISKLNLITMGTEIRPRDARWIEYWIEWLKDIIDGDDLLYDLMTPLDMEEANDLYKKYKA